MVTPEMHLLAVNTNPIETRLRSRLVSQAIKDPDFHSLLQSAASAITTAAKAAPNEATVEAAFEQHLFTVLRAIGVDYTPVKEGKVAGTILRQTGRTDSRFRDVVIEFKHRSAMKTDAQVDRHLDQLKDYLQALGTDTEGDQIGFLTDGLRIVQVVHSASGPFEVSSTAKLDALQLGDLCRVLVTARTSALRAENLVRDFCGDPARGHMFVAARALFDSITKQPTLKSEMLRSEWESLFRLAHEDTSQQRRIEGRRAALELIFDRSIPDSKTEYLCLFCLDTAYAIVAKMVAYKVVSDTLFRTVLQNFKELLAADDSALQVFCAALEDGDLFRQVGILNLLEGDFFSWYSDGAQWNKTIASSVRSILEVLSRYEDSRNVFAAGRAIDLFRQLYEAAIPQVVRGSFGEFYTPLWLAQHVLESSDFKVGERVLDPCCGSGTFLISALQKVRTDQAHRPPAETLATMLRTVVGVDLNPLAVLTARVHYFVYIADLLSGELEGLVIPVFLGDASNVPTVLNTNGFHQVRYQLSTLKTPLEIVLPMSFVSDAQTLFSVMNRFESLLSQRAYVEARAVFVEYAEEHALSDRERDSLLAVADQIAELERREWNGIWARIVANFASTVAIGKFEHIIGNPPWIDWKTLPAGYRERIKQLCVDRGLFSGDRRTGGINLNICALITHVAATNWLAPGGTLAFLMPRELAVQPSYEGWRRSVGGAHCRIKAFHDWSSAGHPFDPVREDFMTFVIAKDRKRSGEVRCIDYSKKRGSGNPWLWKSLDEAKAGLDETERFARAITPDKSSFTFADTRRELREFTLIAGASDYIGREGIEFYPQELVMFTYKRPGPKPGTIFVENFQGKKSKFRIPKQIVLLETKFLFPLVKGPFIKPFEYVENDLLVAFPYDPSDPHRPIERDVLRKQSPLLLAYFLKYEKQMSAQTAYSDSIRAEGEFYGLARTGPYSFARNYVAFRDNTRWAACVITDRVMPWGEKKRYLFQNHAVSMCEDGERRFIGLNEAHYVASILNASVTGRFIKASSDDRSFKIRPPVHVPRFDSNDTRHTALAALSKLAHKDLTKRVEVAAESERLYLELCRERD